MVWRHKQCYHGDASCSDWYSTKSATWRRTYWDESSSFFIRDYTPPMCLCDNHEDKVWQIRYYEDDKNLNNEGNEFFLHDGKPSLNQYAVEKPAWARRVDRAAKKRSRGESLPSGRGRMSLDHD